MFLQWHSLLLQLWARQGPALALLLLCQIMEWMCWGGWACSLDEAARSVALQRGVTRGLVGWQCGSCLMRVNPMSRPCQSPSEPHQALERCLNSHFSGYLLVISAWTFSWENGFAFPCVPFLKTAATKLWCTCPSLWQGRMSRVFMSLTQAERTINWFKNF